MLFDVPKDYAAELVANAKEGSAYRVVEGVIKGRLGNAAWFTNLDHKKRHEELILYKRYSDKEYPGYDNYDAINVDRIAEIPMDWDGAMGVPITFLNKHNPEQFEIMGITDRDNNSGLKTKEYSLAYLPNASNLNRRGVIRVGGEHRPTYVRLLIKKVLSQ